MTGPVFSGKAYISDCLSVKLSTVSKQSPPIHFQMQQDINKSLAFKRSDVKKKKIQKQGPREKMEKLSLEIEFRK